VIVVAAESVIAAVIVAVIVIEGLVDQEWIERVSLTVQTKIW
jgi:outer membrane murein-binding lipoprotein Lpp